MGPQIRVSNLSLSLGNNPILNDVNLEVTPGEIHCIVGPNGGGKTSTLRCILGQMPHTGDIQLEWGENTNIGYVPQFLDFDKTLPITVKNFMAMVCQDMPAFLGLRKANRDLVASALAKVKLENKETTMIGTLSGGERQRLLFAQAMIPESSLVILDEPMTSLDEAGITIFENLIKELAAEGKTILWVNHDMAQVKRLASKVTVVDTEVIASGPTAEVLTEPMMHGNFRSLTSTAEGAIA